MPTFYLEGHRHTLCSALQAALEEQVEAHDTYVACTLVHPLDEHLEVVAPSEAVVRAALLLVKDRVARARVDVQRTGEGPRP